MAKAPTRKELEEEKTTEGEVKYNTKPLTLRIIGCGGAGINLATKLKMGGRCDNDDIVLIDTSLSNITSVNEKLQLLKVGNDDGSGKLRSLNYEKINQFVTGGEISKALADINIFIFSLTGGTGSVIAPLLIKETSRKNKIAIAIAVTNDESRIDITNAFNTLRSVEGIAIKNNIYLPTMVYDNSLNERTEIDNTVLENLDLLIGIIKTSVMELDNTDKKNWLQPIRVIPDVLAAGMKTLFINKMGEGWNNDPKSGEILQDDIEDVDSLLIISKTAENIQATKECQIIFRGYNDSADKPVIASIGSFQPTEYFSKLNDHLGVFGGINKKKSLDIKPDQTIGREIDGMIL